MAVEKFFTAWLCLNASQDNCNFSQNETSFLSLENQTANVIRVDVHCEVTPNLPESVQHLTNTQMLRSVSYHRGLSQSQTLDGELCWLWSLTSGSLRPPV